MTVKFGEIKEIKSPTTPPVANFALETNFDRAFHWDYCREQFAAKFNEKTPGFFFSHLENKGISVASFLNKFEIILDIPEDEQSCFSKTNRGTILWVAPSQFWVTCPMKRSLLTILLRCGMNYDADSDNFDEALFGNFKECDYVRDTKPAILRFMFGFTKFTGTRPQDPNASVVKHGWREEFLKADEPTIRRRLIAPNGVKEISIVGLETLWA